MLDPVTSHLFRNAGRHGPIALMYHAIEPANGPARWRWSVSLRVFRTHLDLLYNYGWSTRTMAELVQTPVVSLPEKTVVITFDDGFENNLDAVDALVARGMRGTWFITTGAIGKAPHWDDSGRPAGKMLAASSLRDMKAVGMEIGSHSVSHPRLPELTDAELTSELSQSKFTLEDILACPVESFAYPYGEWDERCETAVAKAGYRFACTTRTGPALKDNHPLRVRRLAIFNDDSTATLARKLTLMTNDGDWAQVTNYYGRRAINKLRGANYTEWIR